MPQRKTFQEPGQSVWLKKYLVKQHFLESLDILNYLFVNLLRCNQN